MRKLYPSERAVNTIDAPFPGGHGFISVRYDGPMTPDRLEHMNRFWSEIVLPWAEFAIIEESPKDEAEGVSEDDGN